MGTRRQLSVQLDFDVKGENELKNFSSDLRDAAKAGDEAERSLNRVGDGASTGGLRFTELASKISLAQQAFQVVGDAARFAYDNVSQGAQLEFARSQFDNLATSINTTSDALLNNLRSATKGMVSDAELIAGATDIINLGLADTQEETVRLATAVSTLGLDMQQVILTFANNSTARLDALGLSIEDVTSKAAELEAQGFQGDAFDEAVLIGLEEKMTLLGDASETTAGQLQMLEADWKNLTDSLKQDAAAIAGPVVSSMVDMRQASVLIEDALARGVITQGEAFRAQARLAAGGKDLADELEKLGLTVEGLTFAEESNIARAEEMASFYGGPVLEAIASVAKEAEDADAIMLQHGQTMGIVSAESAVLADAVNAASGAFDLGAKQIQAMRDAAEEARPKITAWTDSMYAMTPPIERGTKEMEKLLSHLNALPSRKDVNVNASVTGLDGLERLQNTLSNLGSGSTGPIFDKGSKGSDVDAATGLSDFVVPPGFPNDSFLVGLTSGETVNVTPAGETTNNNNSVSIVQNINGGGANVAAQARDGVMEALAATGLKGFG